MDKFTIIATDFVRGFGITFLAGIALCMVYMFFVPFLFICASAFLIFAIYMLGKTYREGKEKVVDRQ